MSVKSQFSHAAVHDAWMKGGGRFSAMGKRLGCNRRTAWTLAIREGLYKKGDRRVGRPTLARGPKVTAPAAPIIRRGPNYTPAEIKEATRLRWEERMTTARIAAKIGRSVPSTSKMFSNHGGTFFKRAGKGGPAIPRGGSTCPTCGK